MDEDWTKFVPEDLIRSAYKCGDEMAWPRDEAIRAILAVQENGYLILGVDIWIATDPGPTIPTPFVYDWNFERPRVDTPGLSALEFVQLFKWDPADKSHGERPPYFNLTAMPTN